ncbi:MAG TPA: penicillin-binding protein [Saprospiraceae bacterium]|nr:penicillin-binding protein [Saprospiraceae bacterium]HMQ81789.1 penicillin-binding protein [Saprospiraceae bacterium]
MDIKNEVLYRVYILLFGILVPIAVVLMYRTVDIAILQGERWRQEGEKKYLDYRQVEADRGNILTADGSLLATSVPFFDIYFDPLAASDEDFAKYKDTLAHCLATFVLDNYTVGGALEYLENLRKGDNRHILLKRKVTYDGKKFIEEFPLFSLGQNKGGFIARKRSERKRPFGLLAQRTIGYVRDSAHPVGLEGRFNKILSGTPGSEPMICIDPGKDLWIPVNNLTAIEPERGDDLQTTIDIDIQDIAESALLRAMNFHNAEWGTAIVMEVKTGAVRAIANLGRSEEGWWETYNYGIGAAIEPGSTFKTASLMALLEDDLIDLDDTVSIEHGVTSFYDEVMEDASPYSPKLDSIRIREAFLISSNVGVSKLVNQYYGQKTKANGNEGAARYIKRLKDFNLNLPTGVNIDGEANPYIKEAYSTADDWSGTTLPWMSIGYEMKITPLQLLTFYNGIANDGEVMKPQIAQAVLRDGKVIEKYLPTVTNRRLASDKTIRQAKELLLSVVEDERGTAHKLKTDNFRFAGKTGTAQINYKRSSRGTSIGGYQASFVGFFPYEKPKYSCIVVINRPRDNGFYGSDVAGPVFREIADKIFTTQVALHKPLNSDPKPMLTAEKLPATSLGAKEDMMVILDYLDMETFGEAETPFVVLRPQSDSLIMEPRNAVENLVPNVYGLGLRDAVHLLENAGLRVTVVEGAGKVRSQSITAGARIKKGTPIKLRLN